MGEVVAPSVGGGLTRGAVVTMADLTLARGRGGRERGVHRRGSATGSRRSITLDAYPDTSFRGEVRQVVPTADRQRATVQVKVSILDRDPRILPEMGARVDFLDRADSRGRGGVRAPPAPPRFRLPAARRARRGWPERRMAGARRAAPGARGEAGPVSGGFREIARGLSGGERVVTGGVEEPKEGMRVKSAVSAK